MSYVEQTTEYRYPGDFVLSNLDIISTDGKLFSLIDLQSETNIYQNIFKPFMQIEIAIQDTGSFPTIDLQGGQGAGIGMINLNDMLGKAMGPKTKKKKTTVADSYEILVNEESDKLIDTDHIVNEAKKAVEDNGIVFIDEIDKVCARSERVGGDRKSTRLNSSHSQQSRMPSSA